MKNIIASGKDGEIEKLIKLDGIFTPKARVCRNKFYAGNSSARFVHYTTAEAAMSIIKTKRLWMRNATCMSDFREVQHGFDILNSFFQNTQNLERFTGAIDQCFPGITQEAIGQFNQWWSNIKLNTYVASISEHQPKEDNHGRLSMWRGFGASAARVAIVFNIPWVTDTNPQLNISFNPVIYDRQEEVFEDIEQVIKNVNKNVDFIKAIDRQHILLQIVQMLITGSTCIKHEGFGEEREWRIIYMPTIMPSELIEHSIETINGIPQTVYKLPLDAKVDESLSSFEMARLFDSLIIGPSAYPWVQYEAFVEALKQSGIQDAEKRVLTSGIPIRT